MRARMVLAALAFPTGGLRPVRAIPPGQRAGCEDDDLEEDDDDYEDDDEDDYEDDDDEDLDDRDIDDDPAADLDNTDYSEYPYDF